MPGFSVYLREVGSSVYSALRISDVTLYRFLLSRRLEYHDLQMHSTHHGVSILEQFSRVQNLLDKMLRQRSSFPVICSVDVFFLHYLQQ